MVTITANIAGKDLGSVAGEVTDAIARAGHPPRGVTVSLRGQAPPMNQTMSGLQWGLLLAIVVIAGTTLNVQSFMGAIMAIGVSVANAILLVTFAE